MNLFQNQETSNYELVFSTRQPKAGSRDGNAGDKSGKTKKSGSRKGGTGTGTTKGNPSRGQGYFKEDKPENFTPSDVIKKKQNERKEQD